MLWPAASDPPRKMAMTRRLEAFPRALLTMTRSPPNALAPSLFEPVERCRAARLRLVIQGPDRSEAPRKLKNTVPGSFSRAARAGGRENEPGSVLPRLEPAQQEARADAGAERAADPVAGGSARD